MQEKYLQFLEWDEIGNKLAKNKEKKIFFLNFKSI